jgi:hypothetical protein
VKAFWKVRDPAPAGDADEAAPCSIITSTPTMSGAAQTKASGAPATASEPLIVARTPISAPTEISILPETITIDMPTAATAI